MKIFECPRCGEEAGKRISNCDSRRFGSCPYRTVLSPIPCEPEDFNSLLLIFLVSIFLIWIYPTNLGAGSFFLTALNLLALGLLALIFCLASSTMLTLILGKQVSIASRERAELWQSRSIKNYEYYLRIISDVRTVPLADLGELSKGSPIYLSETEQILLRDFLSSRKANPDLESTVITLLTEVMEVLIYRLIALGLVTLKQGTLYASYWKKVDEHSDSRAFFVFRNFEKEQAVDSLSAFERIIINRLDHWNSPEQKHENFVAPDLNEFLELFSQEHSLAGIATSLLVSQRQDTVLAQNSMERKEILAIIQSIDPTLAVALHREVQSVFYFSNSSVRVWVLRMGLRLKRKQVRVSLVAGSLLVFFFLRFYTPIRHASQFTAAVKNMDLDEGAHGILDDIEHSVKALGAKLLKSISLDGIWSDIKRNSENLIDSSKQAFDAEYAQSKRDMASLMSKLDSATTEYKLMVLNQLAEYKEDLAAYRDQLIGLLSDQSDAVKIKALELLATMEDKASDSVDEVTGLLDSRNEAVQKAALSTLGSMGSSAGVSVPEVLSLARQTESTLAPFAVDALRAINTPAAQRALLSIGLRLGLLRIYNRFLLEVSSLLGCTAALRILGRSVGRFG